MASIAPDTSRPRRVVGPEHADYRQRSWSDDSSSGAVVRIGGRRHAPLGGPADVLLVTDETRTGLAAARSLKRNRVPFAVLGFGGKGVVAVSRHVDRYHAAPQPTEPE